MPGSSSGLGVSGPAGAMNRSAAAGFLYFFAHPEFYEAPDRHPLTDEYRNLLRERLPESWRVERGDVWLHALLPEPGASGAPGDVDVGQGFKIHVSATTMCAPLLLELVVPVCVRERVAFKVAGDPALLDLLNSKLQARGSSGKFMTLYPQDMTTFLRLLDELYRRTKDQAVAGPYILSDRRYRDSRVLFYRYGGFHPLYELHTDGTRSACVVAPSGEFVADERTPYFRLPPWVRDPFDGIDGEGRDKEASTATTVASSDDNASPLLNGRYLIEGAVIFSNAGGIYHGLDTGTGQAVVVKEARPGTNCWAFDGEWWDAPRLLRHEYEMLCRLDGLPFVPRPVELFREWEHAFLVEERVVDAIGFHDFWAREEIILAPYIRRPGRLERFLPVFRHAAMTLIAMVTAVHERGVLLGDLSPQNVLIDPDTHRMWFIDFESAIREGGEGEPGAYAARWGTPGFMRPERTSPGGRLKRQDDWYAAGMILYGCVVPVTPLFTLRPEAAGVFLDRFTALGVPAEVRAVIDCLCRGEAAEAMDVLTGWSP
ncbi:protein kinase domain-containing protein [Streptomyces sp. URMC 124]|uniref:class III lanthionine synthetase LanKC N-terminal domain-containing protein n=1 Tax=Streptomyces sp. URMC 124 TaxID=3423405 RepID=UPI003F1A064D